MSVSFILIDYIFILIYAMANNTVAGPLLFLLSEGTNLHNCVPDDDEVI